MTTAACTLREDMLDLSRSALWIPFPKSLYPSMRFNQDRLLAEVGCWKEEQSEAIAIGSSEGWKSEEVESHLARSVQENLCASLPIYSAKLNHSKTGKKEIC